MADIKISALTSVEEVQSTDVVPVVSGSATMKASASQIKDYVNGDLDYNDSATAGSYVTAVSESNGVVNVTKEAADTTPTASSKKMVTSGGVYTELGKLSTKIGNGTLDTVAQTLVGGINELKAKSATKPKYIFIGDSYAVGTSAGEQYGWIAQCKTYLGLTEGTDVFSYGGGGYGFVGNSGTFLSLLNQAISAITDKDSITNIFVAGGFNDIGKSGVPDAIRTFCTTAKTNFKNAKIKIAFVGAFCNKRLSTAINPQTFLSTKYEYLNSDGKYDVDVDVYGCLLQRDDFIGSDGIHPTISGYNHLAKYVAQSILGHCQPSISPLQSFTFTPITDLTEASGMQHYWRRTANEVMVWFANLYLTGTITSTDNTNSPLVIGTINDISLEPISNDIGISGAELGFRLTTNDGVQHNATGHILITTNGEVYIRCPIFKSNGSRYNWNEVTLIEGVNRWFSYPIDAICV